MPLVAIQYWAVRSAAKLTELSVPKAIWRSGAITACTAGLAFGAGILSVSAVRLASLSVHHAAFGAAVAFGVSLASGAAVCAAVARSVRRPPTGAD